MKLTGNQLFFITHCGAAAWAALVVWVAVVTKDEGWITMIFAPAVAAGIWLELPRTPKAIAGAVMVAGFLVWLGIVDAQDKRAARSAIIERSNTASYYAGEVTVYCTTTESGPGSISVTGTGIPPGTFIEAYDPRG